MALNMSARYCGVTPVKGRRNISSQGKGKNKKLFMNIYAWQKLLKSLGPSGKNYSLKDNGSKFNMYLG